MNLAGCLFVVVAEGMSVTAARLLLDRLSEESPGIKILVAHDCDRSGFSIFGTLGSDTRRYTFENAVDVIDIGLRLDEAQAMGLQDEAMPLGKTSPSKAAEKLRQHGATEDEIEFMVERERRIELNAMTADQFIDRLEGKLAEHGIEKVIPDDDMLEQAARRAIVRAKVKELLEEERDRIENEVAEMEIPTDLRVQVAAVFEGDDSLSWDKAVDKILGGGSDGTKLHRTKPDRAAMEKVRRLFDPSTPEGTRYRKARKKRIRRSEKAVRRASTRQREDQS